MNAICSIASADSTIFATSLNNLLRKFKKLKVLSTTLMAKGSPNLSTKNIPFRPLIFLLPSTPTS
ncbi:MAG: hypothetical protein NZ516_07250 [Raineya sp.]|nr:hypothetical protein [Raineya sp.]